MLFRPVRQSDLDQLNELARQSLYGLTTVPKDETLMGKRVRESERSFANLEDADPQGQLYLFVLVDPETDRVVGTSGVVSKVGGFKPFYAYRLAQEQQTSVTLNHEITHPVLHLVKEHDGPSEIGSLFLHPDYRGGGRGRLLSLSRFLFMAEFEHLFEQEVIAEMRGIIDEKGSSPFWEALGTHFFPLDLPNADMLTLIQKDFIEELMPKHPVYLDLLPKEAREAVAEVHPNTVPARKMLESEGFQFQDLVDIFEAGPVLHCQRSAIRSAKESRVGTIESTFETSTGDAIQCIVATSAGGFRSSLGTVIENESGVSINATCCTHLGVEIGDRVRYVESRPAN
ncbi:MAG: arginine N-succinyltransferase [Planctomycetota bacterium]